MKTMKRSLRVHLLSAWLLVLPATVSADTAEETWDKVVFHLDAARTARWALMLARSYLDDVPKAQIVFVAYGPGVNFLLEDAKDDQGDPFEYAVWNLAQRGVDFRVCAATLKARGIPTSGLVDVAKVVPSGISEIARLQIRDEFAYLKP